VALVVGAHRDQQKHRAQQHSEGWESPLRCWLVVRLSFARPIHPPSSISQKNPPLFSFHGKKGKGFSCLFRDFGFVPQLLLFSSVTSEKLARGLVMMANQT
jgi:hypothetical protein